MRKKGIFMGVVLILCFAVLTGCGNKANEDGGQGELSTGAEYKKLSAEEAKNMIDSGENIVVVDVRTAEEYEEKHIPGALLIPNETIGSELIKELDKEDVILIYCRSGNRSKQAAQKLLDIGYTVVYDFGGIIDWPYETETGAADNSASKTDSVVDVAEGTANADNAADKSNAETADSTEAAEKTELTGEFKKFEAVDIYGNSTTPEEIFGKADMTVLNLWATFCGPCIREMPDLGELAREYAGSGIQIVGIPVDASLDTTLETAVEIVEATDVEYLNLIPTRDLYHVYLKNVRSVPETLFVDSTGTIRKSVIGSRSKEKWQKLIDETYEQIVQEKPKK